MPLNWARLIGERLPAGIIIEGADGTGKSTLAAQLNEGLYDNRAMVIHSGPPKTLGLFDYFYHRLADLVNSGEPFIMDRGYLGELVYGPLLRSTSLLSLEMAWMLHFFCQANGVLEILARPPYDVAYDAWGKRLADKGELVTDAETYAAIHEQYNHEIAMMFDLHWYDWTADHCLMVGKTWWKRPEFVLGSHSAHTLLVADRPNGQHDLPFFTSRGAGCSRYFWNAAVRAMDLNFAVVNAYTKYGRHVDIQGLVDDMPNLKNVVALGTDANKRLWHLKISHSLVPHPQYWKRFHHRDMDAYISLLKDGAGLLSKGASA